MSLVHPLLQDASGQQSIRVGYTIQVHFDGRAAILTEQGLSGFGALLYLCDIAEPDQLTGLGILNLHTLEFINPTALIQPSQLHFTLAARNNTRWYVHAAITYFTRQRIQRGIHGQQIATAYLYGHFFFRQSTELNAVNAGGIEFALESTHQWYQF